jgi:L-threonylcarbamoyladenylate synthase
MTRNATEGVPYNHMSTLVLDVRSPAGLADGIRRAAEVMRGGGLVCFPTETVYGLGANALDADAVRRIFEAKGRPANNPLIVHIADRERAKAIVAEWPESAQRLAEGFWPGPLTLVLPRGEAIPDAVTAGGATVAVRVPAHPVARELLAACGLPIAAPSANRSARLSPTTAAHVKRDLDGKVDLILDGGPTPGGIESTVLDLTGPPQLLRPGLIEVPALEAVIGPVLRPQVSAGGAAALPSPGMLPRHYAPRTPLECVEDDGLARVAELHAQGVRVALVSHHPGIVQDVPAGVPVARMPADPAGYAAMLYAVLHLLDERQLERIVVALPPAGEEWMAVRDRLRRSAVKGEGD